MLIPSYPMMEIITSDVTALRGFTGHFMAGVACESGHAHSSRALGGFHMTLFRGSCVLLKVTFVMVR